MAGVQGLLGIWTDESMQEQLDITQNIWYTILYQIYTHGALINADCCAAAYSLNL